MFLDGGRRQIHFSRNAGDRLVVHPPSEQHGAPQWRKPPKGGGETSEPLSVRGDRVRQGGVAGIGLWNGGLISTFAAKSIDQAVGCDLERERVQARDLPLPRIVKKLGQALLCDVFCNILGVAAAPDINQHRVPNVMPIGIREGSVWSVTAGISGGFDPKSYGGVILTHAARHRCGL